MPRIGDRQQVRIPSAYAFPHAVMVRAAEGHGQPTREEFHNKVSVSRPAAIQNNRNLKQPQSGRFQAQPTVTVTACRSSLREEEPTSTWN